MEFKAYRGKDRTGKGGKRGLRESCVRVGEGLRGEYLKSLS